MQTSKLTSVSSAVDDAVALLSIELYVTMNCDHGFGCICVVSVEMVGRPQGPSIFFKLVVVGKTKILFCSSSVLSHIPQTICCFRGWLAL